MSDVAERAERLRVLLAAYGAEPALSPVAAVRPGLPLLSDRDMALLDGATPIDFDLANALIAAGREFRAAQFGAFERLLATIPGGSDPLREQIGELPPSQRRDAARACVELNWINKGD